ncbi:hypothetical protein BpHYR1_007393 [Brachionus plicatilis]|uniref:Uncharacterized protein n=1 Tax=Brachionus plicatilis TaxID=10195 RepID=A0A3M7RVU5_BRAPC|nr:hypothetical protein BpHYR1_007393 [Brachionus plicatilis]
MNEFLHDGTGQYAPLSQSHHPGELVESHEQRIESLATKIGIRLYSIYIFVKIMISIDPIKIFFILFKIANNTCKNLDMIFRAKKTTLQIPLFKFIRCKNGNIRVSTREEVQLTKLHSAIAELREFCLKHSAAYTETTKKM